MEYKLKALDSKNNVLLVKGDIGQCPPITRKLPGNEFSYGKLAVRDSHGAGALTSDWQHNIPNF
jgi:hypothetical protein